MLLASCSLSKVLWPVSSCVTPKPGSRTLEVSVGPTLGVCLRATSSGPAACLCVGKGEDGGFWRVLGFPGPTCHPGKTQTLAKGTDHRDLLLQCQVVEAEFSHRLSPCPHRTCSPVSVGGRGSVGCRL